MGFGEMEKLCISTLMLVCMNMTLRIDGMVLCAG